MAIKDKDFIKLEFTGKVADTDDIFDTTIEEVAKDADIFNDKKTYGPIPIVIGGGHLLPALDEAIIGLKVGDEKTIEIESKDAYGERDSKLIQLIPMKEFKKQGMTPVPGMVITADNQNGKVLTVNGGRVKVDFNHELAGKDVVYDIKITDAIEDDEEKIKSLIQLHYAYPNFDIDKTEITFDGDSVSITLDEITRFDQQSYMDVTFARFRISKDIWENMDYEKVNFVDQFEKKEVEEAEKEVEVEADSEE
ncbi:peptidylprolyl isomerase [Methanobrevibacter sp. DSM 116169]|uniref:peptidylprolyl isomerase n=1 Tax=Methanobrevibacter sp. DSM 116169 TaxID=3242727 RepID=UPI0038FD2C08